MEKVTFGEACEYLIFSPFIIAGYLYEKITSHFHVGRKLGQL